MRGILALSLLAFVTCKIRLPAGETPKEGDFPCEVAEQCPAPPQGCLLSACWEEQCVYVPAPDGSLPVDEQITGDCKERHCDGHGGIVSYKASFDVPPDDGNPCTHEICDQDSPTHAPKIAGTACGGGGEICTGTGTCGVCLPEEARCDGEAVALCDEAGQWREPQRCARDKPRCHRAQCVGIEETAVAGGHACARFEDGSVACWGANEAGQLGDVGPETPAWTTGYAEVAFGPRHACGRRGDDSLWCWGAGDYGQLGGGDFSSSTAAVEVGARGSQVAVGRDHSCALTAEGRVLCWGRNDRGQLGRGQAAGAPLPPSARPSPGSGRKEPVTLAPEGVVGLRLDGHHSCLRLASGGQACWGLAPYPLAPSPSPDDDEPDADAEARLEARKAITGLEPRAVSGVEQAVEIGCGADHCCARIADGTVRCWGAGEHGQLGAANSDSFAARPVPKVSDASKLEVGRDFACVLRAGQVICWGDNRRGQLGTGESQPHGTPRAIASLGSVQRLGLGDLFACALLDAGEVYCWGDGRLGQLGSEQQLSRVPIAVDW